MSGERETLVTVVRAMRAMADRREACPPERLRALAGSIEKVLDVAVWEQTPSWAEWRDRVGAACRVTSHNTDDRATV